MKLNLSQDNFDFIGIIISTDVVQCLDEITILSQKKIALLYKDAVRFTLILVIKKSDNFAKLGTEKNLSENCWF